MIPLIISDEELELALQDDSGVTTMSSRTYKIDFDTGTIYPEFVDQDEAIRQAVIKAILTVRDKYLIYSEDYGCEVPYLMGAGHTIEYLQIEIPRLINEAVMIDDRVQSCEDFVIDQTGDTVSVSFTVITDIQASVKVEVTI